MPGPRWWLRAAACPAGLAVTFFATSAQSQEPAVADLMAGAAAYVQRFSQGFATLLGDERYEQRLRVGIAQNRMEPDREAGSRLLLSEVLFVWLAEERSWLTARIVHQADGKQIADSKTRLERLMADTSTTWATRVRRLRDEGARFNIGRLERNFSDPTMVLQFLDTDTQRRFQFTLRDRGRIENEPAWRVSFKEQSRPTVVQSGGRDVLASGDVWLAAADHAVLQTRVTLVDNQFNLRISASVNVAYRRDARIGIWVPSQMRETYEQRGTGVYRGRIATFEDRIECVATYSNFRRFETDARIVN